MTHWISTHALDVAVYLSVATALLRALSRVLAPYPRARAVVEVIAALSGDYATLRIATPAGLAEDFGLRPALIPGHATAPGSSIVGTGSTRRTIATGGTPTVSLR